MFVDSGGWIALVRANDRHHAAADAAFREAVARRVRLVTTNLVLAEVHRFFLFRGSPAVALAVARRMGASPSLRTVFCTADHHDRALEWLARYSDQVVTYTDAASFAVMVAERIEHFLGFDHDFETAGFTRWTP